MNDLRIRYILKEINKHSNMVVDYIHDKGCIKIIDNKNNTVFKITEPLYSLSNKTLINVILVQLEQNFCATVDYIW